MKMCVELFWVNGVRGARLTMRAADRAVRA